MEKLKSSDDSRMTYDADNGAVRSFFGVDLVEPPDAAVARAARAPGDTTQTFLDDNKDAFKLDDVSLARVEERRGSASTAVTYRQQHNGIPVYGGKIVVGVEQASNRVASAVNKVDYALPPELTRESVRVPEIDVPERVRQQLSPTFANVKTGPATLYVYRCTPTTLPETESPATREKVLRAEALGRGEPGRVYLAWQVPADTTEPSGNWEVFLDAQRGELIQVKDRRRYSSVKGFVFLPDPITSSGNAALSSATAVATLNSQRHEVDIENLDPPNGSTFTLNGKWIETRDIESPNFDVPATGTHFKFPAGDRRFLSVNAYFWIDRVIAYLQQFNVPTFNDAVNAQRIGVDAQGVQGDDNSHFTTDLHGRPYLAFGEGGVPDAADAHVVVHEYGHALHFYMNSSQNNKGSEEGFGDFLAGAWLDRFNTRQFQRESVFPWDNNEGDRYSGDRFFNTRRRFSDSTFGSIELHIKGSVLAATLWDLFLSLGGATANANQRTAAADKVIHLYLEMLVSLADESSYQDIGRGILHADVILNGGANGAAIKTAFLNRGLQLNGSRRGSGRET
jgi:zinc metalloprotease ZmpB